MDTNVTSRMTIVCTYLICLIMKYIQAITKQNVRFILKLTLYIFYFLASIRKSIPLRSGTSDQLYLKELSTNLKAALIEFAPNILLYNAGTDSLIGDPLGALNISAEVRMPESLYIIYCLRESSNAIVAYFRSHANIQYRL